MADQPTPGPQRAISTERTELRARIPTFVVAAIAVISATITATAAVVLAWADIKHDMGDQGRKVDEVIRWARSFDRDFDRRVMRSDPVADTSAPRVSP